MNDPIKQAVSDFADYFGTVIKAQKAALAACKTEERMEYWRKAIEATEEAQNLTDDALLFQD